MKIMKVVDIQDRVKGADNTLFEQSHAISCEWLGNGNDSYYLYRMGEFASGAYGDDMKDNVDVLDAWLTELGIEQGEEILIKHWW